MQPKHPDSHWFQKRKLSKLRAAIRRKALADADKIKAHLASIFGGRVLQMPTEATQAQHTQILADFNGNNHSELADKYGIPVAFVYQAIYSAKSDQRIRTDFQALVKSHRKTVRGVLQALRRTGITFPEKTAMNPNQIDYALAKQVPDMARGFTIHTSYGDIEIDAEQAAPIIAAVKNALEKLVA